MFAGVLTSLPFCLSPQPTKQQRYLFGTSREPMVSAAAQMVWMTMCISVPKVFSLMPKSPLPPIFRDARCVNFVAADVAGYQRSWPAQTRCSGVK
jgi:hypothetical protein